MRILHVRNVANVGATLASAQSALGHDSRCIQLVKSRHGFSGDVNLDLPASYRWTGAPSRLRAMRKAIEGMGRLDVYHIHDGGLLPAGLDVATWFKRRGLACVHWHGTKLRGGGRWLSRLADMEVVSTPDLLKFAPRAEWVPMPIDLGAYAPSAGRGEGAGEVVRAVHAPTNRAFKGTGQIIAALEELRREGCRVELEVVENRPRAEAVAALARADIVIDQLNPAIGTYGMVSVEGMALGKPVVCHLDGRYAGFFKDCPIASPGRGGLKEAVRSLAEDDAARSSLGRRGRAYVEKVHDSRAIAKRLVSMYEGLQ